MSGFEFKPGRAYKGITKKPKPAPAALEVSSTANPSSAPSITPVMLTATPAAATQPPAPPPAPPSLTSPPPAPSAATSPPPEPSAPRLPHQQTLGTQYFPPGYTFVVLHGHDEAVVCYNTDYAAPDARVNEDSGGVFTGEDGWWGYYEWSIMPTLLDVESPHLALCEVLQGDALAGNAMFGELTAAHLQPYEPKDEHAPKEMFVMQEKMHKAIGSRVRQLRNTFEVVASIFRSLFTDMGQPHFKSLGPKVQALFEKAIIPTEQALSMYQLWGGLRWYNIEHAADWNACWHAFHRAFADTSAFVDMCAALLPETLPVENAGEVLAMLREQRHAQDQKPGISRRGVILAGTDILDYHAVFMRMGAPVYCLVPQSVLGDARQHIRPADPFRCSTKRCDTLVHISERGLPGVCYPPEGVVWVEFERISRGILERRRDAAVQAHEREVASKAKRDRREQIDGERQAKREKAFQEKRPTTTITAEVYKAIAMYSPALRPYFDRQLKAKDEGKNKDLHHFAPLPYQAFQRGFQRAMETPEIAQFSGAGPRLSFYPSVGQILSGDRMRVARRLTMFVWMLPTFNRRVVLSRSDPNVARLGTKTIKMILNGVYFVPGKKNEGVENRYETFWADPDKHWKNGGAAFWGEKEYKRLLEEPGARPSLGRLPCGHEATVKYIYDNDDVAWSLLVSIGQLDALYALIRMTKPNSLEGTGLAHVQEPTTAIYTNGRDAKRAPKMPVAEAGAGKTDMPDIARHNFFKHRTPSLEEFNSANGTSVLGVIRRIVMHTGMISPSGWPKPWDAGACEEKERRQWLVDFKKFLINYSSFGTTLDDMMRVRAANDWLSTTELKTKWFPPSLNAGKQSQLEEHLFWRYSLTAMKCGLLAAPFYYEGPSGIHAGCAQCRAPPAVPDGAYMDHDLENEYEDWEYPKHWNEQ